MNRYWNQIIEEDMKYIVTNEMDYSKLDHCTVLVTGANGMLAAYIIHTLMYLNSTSKFKIKVIALVRSRERAKERFGQYLEDSNFYLCVQDVCEEIELDEKVDYIVHAASNASPKYILSNPVDIIKTNSIGTLRILEFAKKAGTKNLLFTSTREVYGKLPPEVAEIQEDNYGSIDPQDLRSCYPESKRMAETLLESYRYQYGVPYTIARIAHSYGPGMDIEEDGRIMSDLISYTVNEKDIIMNSDGTAIRAFCYVSDAVKALFYILLHGESGQAYNVANEKEPYAVRDVAAKLTQLWPEKGLKVLYKKPEDKDNSGYCKYERVKLSTDKLQNLGWIPQITLEEGLKRTVNSFK
ncbi:MAG: NAD-dependent epimerase/dehydratase family protein [Mobilitalea sp.]